MAGVQNQLWNLTVFEIYKYMFHKLLWACLGMPEHAHLKLWDQFVALIDMKLHAQNQLN